MSVTHELFQADTGIRPPFAFEASSDLDADVRQSLARIHASPFIPHKNVRASSTTSRRASCAR